MKIALIAGETSGDQLGGWLMEALKRLDPALTFIGIGGDAMQAQGMQSLFPMHEIALMGFAEILPHLFRLKRRIKETVAYLEREQPDVLVTIDSPGFTFRVVKALRANGKAKPRFIHYVAPTVWAYKPQRAAKTAALYDQLLCLLPFEPAYFEKEGLRTDFVGHEIAWWWKSKSDGSAFRARHGFGDAPLLAVFPGSRNGELNRLLPVITDAIKRLHTLLPNLQLVVQVPGRLKPRLLAETANWPVAPLVLASNEEKKEVFAASTAALAKSGTVALECALAGLPAVTTYKANPISVWIVRRTVTTVYANIANILLKREAIPELIQETCTSDGISTALLPLLTGAAAREAQKQALSEIAAMLGAKDTVSPSDKAAKIILGRT